MVLGATIRGVKETRFPLCPCGRGWLREAKTGEGLVPRRETPHPSRTASAPPSPTRGEGKKERRHICSPHTGSAIEYFTWLSAKLDSIEAMPSRRVSLFFRNASYDDRSAAT